MKIKNLLGLCALVSVIGLSATAQNPIIHNQFTADPTARVFNGKVYLFPSHDIKAPEGAKLRKFLLFQNVNKSYVFYFTQQYLIR